MKGVEMAKKATDPCRAERARVAKSEALVQEMEERLADTPTPKRAILREKIRTEKTKLRGFQRQLAACLAAHPTRGGGRGRP
ncbi:MAG: hypothetical protein ABIT71_13535 [Vicinamibacteraceae bacterium]